MHGCVLITFPHRTAPGKALRLVYINACTHTQILRTRQTEWWMEEAASETTIRGTESDQRRTTEGRNHRGRPQTGRQRKPSHGSEPRGAYQISVQTSLILWPLLLLLCAPFLLSVLFTAMFELLCVFFLALLLNELKSVIQLKKKTRGDIKKVLEQYLYLLKDIC